MNSDFRVSTAYFEHYKICKLKRRLGSDGVLAHLQLLAWTAKNKPEGTLSGMDDEDVCIAAHWDGDTHEFITMLTTLTLLDKTDDGYYVHNWEKHNGYASGAARRSEAARIAAKAKWDRKLQTVCDGRTDADNTGCDSRTNAVRTAEKRNAPSPTPIPSPSPMPLPTPSNTPLYPPKGETLTLVENDSATKPEPKPQPAKPTRPELPKWIDPEAWDGFVAHRRGMRKPINTPRAITILVNKLTKFKEQGHDPNALLDLAVERGWQSVYVPNDFGGTANNKPTQPKKMYGMGMISDMSKIPDEDCVTPYDVDYEL